MPHLKFLPQIMQALLLLHFFSLIAGLRIALPAPQIAPEFTMDKQTMQRMTFDQFLSMFDGVTDMEEGEAEGLSKLMGQLGLTRLDLHEARFRHSTPRQEALKAIATKEERNRGHNLGSISHFGSRVPKIPRSFVESISNLSHTKIHNFMFSGSTESNDLIHRGWLKDWVRQHFKEGDYYRSTDAHKSKNYHSLGSFDVYGKDDEIKGFRPKDDPDWRKPIKYDTSYWEAMSQSNFVLCPGGDYPWSYRFYETFGTKAIPLINDYKTDWASSVPETHAINQIHFEYKMTNDTLVYDPEMGERNYVKFIKYLTWIEGDNAPDGY